MEPLFDAPSDVFIIGDNERTNTKTKYPRRLTLLFNLNIIPVTPIFNFNDIILATYHVDVRVTLREEQVKLTTFSTSITYKNTFKPLEQCESPTYKIIGVKV